MFECSSSNASSLAGRYDVNHHAVLQVCFWGHCACALQVFVLCCIVSYCRFAASSIH